MNRHAANGTSESAARSLVDRLALAHLDGLSLSRWVLAVQEQLNESELRAHQAIDLAAASPGDERAVDRAVIASKACEHAAERESRVTAEWAAHRLLVEDLLEEASMLLGRPLKLSRARGSGVIANHCRRR